MSSLLLASSVEKISNQNSNTNNNNYSKPISDISQKENTEKINIIQNQNDKIDDEKNKFIESISFILSRKIRWFSFSLFLILNLLMNFDHGTVPAATEQLRNYLNLDNSELGLFGSLVFLGVIIGSLISLSIINTFNRKYILMIFLILCGFALLFFTQTKNYFLLCVDRVVIGIFQAFISIYLPLWIDQFGIEKKKTTMIAFIQTAPCLGIVLGYIMTSLLNIYLTYLPFYGDVEENERWLFSFYIQAILVWILSFSFLFIPDKYFNSKARRVPVEVEERLNKIIENNKEKKDGKNISFFYEGNDNNNEIENLNENKNDNNKNIENENDEVKNNENKSNNENNENKNIAKKEISFCKKLKLIFSEPLFIFNVLTMSFLYFVVTCIQYWGSDYMLIALDIKNDQTRLICFSTVCITGPTLGVLLGGFIVDKLGGYETKKAILFCFGIVVSSIISAIPLPLVDSLISYVILLWFLLLCGASVLAPLMGMIIACLPKDVQGSGNSFCIFFCNLLGYFPGPFVYGFIEKIFHDDKHPDKGSRIAQKFTIWFTFVIIGTMGVATLIRCINDDKYTKKMIRLRKEKNENENNCKNENNDEGNNNNYDEEKNELDYRDRADAIRPRESSLAFNTEEQFKLANIENEEKNEKVENKEANEDSKKELLLS